jgi:hypothetical protein
MAMNHLALEAEPETQVSEGIIHLDSFDLWYFNDAIFSYIITAPSHLGCYTSSLHPTTQTLKSYDNDRQHRLLLIIRLMRGEMGVCGWLFWLICATKFRNRAILPFYICSTFQLYNTTLTEESLLALYWISHLVFLCYFNGTIAWYIWIDWGQLVLQ